jgi:Flp pilus assembly protein CpaB
MPGSGTTGSLRARLIVLSQWPRRIAALGCLLLAAISAFAPTARPGGPPPSTTAPVAPTLAPGQVAVAVRLADGGAGLRFIRAGDRIDLLAASAPTALAGTAPMGKGASASIDSVSVLAVRAPPDASPTAEPAGGTEVVVAVDRAQALRLADFMTAPIFAALDKYP